jgi:hypothetical protein
VSVAAEHPQQVAGADLVGDQRPGHAQQVWPLGGDLGDVDRVAGDRLQRRGNKRPRSPIERRGAVSERKGSAS